MWNLHRRSLPPLLGQQMCRHGLPTHGRMAPVLGSKLRNDDLKQPSFPAVVWPRRSLMNGPDLMVLARTVASIMGDIDGCISLISKLRDRIPYRQSQQPLFAY